MSNFKSHRVVPDVLDTWPPHTAVMQYHHHHEANLGNTLAISDTQSQPKVLFPSEKGAMYTVTVVDPDAPSASDPEYRHFLHWLVVNVPGTGGDHIDVHQGNTIAAYMGPAPPAKSGPHRYVLVVYKQKGQLEPTSLMEKVEKMEERMKFDLTGFVGKIPSAELWAGNFFQAEKE